MNQDFAQRRRVALALAITVIAVPAAFLLNRNNEASTAPTVTFIHAGGPHAALDSFDDEIEKIPDDQERRRENIETLSKTAEAKPLISRYIEKVNTQETRLEQIESERKSLQVEIQRLNGELAREIRNFEI